MSSDPLTLHRHRWVAAPSSRPASRTLLLLHGTGGDENDLIDIGREIDPAANLLSPRGNVLENGMPRFFRRHSEGVFDLDDLRARAADLAAWIAAVTRRYDIAPGSLHAVGYSNGANTAAALLLLHPGVLGGAVLMRAMMPIAPPNPPNLGGTRVLMLTGAADPIVPSAGAETLARALADAGASVDHRRLDAGHNLTRQDLIAARAHFTN